MENMKSSVISRIENQRLLYTSGEKVPGNTLPYKSDTIDIPT